MQAISEKFEVPLEACPNCHREAIDERLRPALTSVEHDAESCVRSVKELNTGLFSHNLTLPPVSSNPT
ncbi:hypothetical protein EDF23_10433 [Curtobacterium sp. PhB128]|nr:hypothetical protein EDF23_10433 [Curtobacterium sp. PhB128]TCL95171.1 hypothetical protein EDF29_10433 [Curtobacterium sp. PhB138]